jgi:hypothetical protein
MATPAFLIPVRSRFEEALSTLSPRDRQLLGVLIVFFMLIFLGGSFYLGYRHLNGLQTDISDKEHTLMLLKSMKADYEDSSRQLSTIEDKLKKSGNQDVSAFVEKAAQKTGITTNLQSVREKGITEEGNLEEKKYQIEISKISLQQLIDFLHELEGGSLPLRVRTSKTRTVVADGKKALSVSLEISTFRLLETAPPEAPPAETPSEP